MQQSGQRRPAIAIAAVVAAQSRAVRIEVHAGHGLCGDDRLSDDGFSDQGFSDHVRSRIQAEVVEATADTGVPATAAFDQSREQIAQPDYVSRKWRHRGVVVGVLFRPFGVDDDQRQAAGSLRPGTIEEYQCVA